MSFAESGYIKNGSDSRNTAWVKCENDDFDQVSGALIHSDDTTRERKIYEYAIKDNATFNMYSAIGVAKYPNDLFKGRNTTCITIVKDDYYFYEWNAFSGKQTKYSTRMWSCNYFINRIKNYNSKMHYIIDLRPQSDNLLKDMCEESGGKYIQYSEENLDKLIELINARRAYIEE